MATDLCRLAEFYGVDKTPKILHTYTPAYDRILSTIRGSARLVIEIGIGHPALMVPIVGASYKAGASLRMWKAYFPCAQIVGCDIRRDIMFQDERIMCRLLDQSDEASLIGFRNSITTSADLIVDDGSHEREHMVLTFKTLWPLVKVGGYYIIEDVKREDLAYFERLGNAFIDSVLIYSHKGKNSWDSFVCFLKTDIYIDTT